MKKIFLIALCTILTYGAFSVSPQNGFKKLMNQADSLLEKKMPRSAMAIYDQLLRKIKPQKEPLNYLWVTLSKYDLELKNHFREEDAVLFSLDSLKRRFETPYRTIIVVAEMEAYSEIMNKSRLEGRNHVAICDSIPRVEWCEENYQEKIMQLLSEAFNERDQLSRLSSRTMEPYLTDNDVENLNLSALEAIGNRILSINIWSSVFVKELREKIKKIYEDYGFKESLLLLKMKSLEFYHKEGLNALMEEAKGSKVESLIKRKYAFSLMDNGEYDAANEILEGNRNYAKDTMVRQMLLRINKESVDESSGFRGLFRFQIEPYPNQEWQLHLSIRNCKSIKFDLYKLPESFDKYKSSQIKLNKDFTFIKGWSHTVPPSKSKNVRKVATLMPPLPLGNYAVRISSRDDSFWILFSTSSMAMVSKTNLMTVIDRLSGEPIVHAPVKYASFRDTTDQMGCFRMPYDLRNLNVSVERDGEVLEQQCYVYQERERRIDPYDTYFLTESPIYKPGDTVRFKLIIQKENCVLPGKKIKLELSFGAIPLSTYDLISDDYGSASGEYVIPTDYHYDRLEFHDGVQNHSVAVQSYKTPQIKIAMAREIRVKRGDSIFIKGKVSTANDFPVANAKVVCRSQEFKDIAEVLTEEDGSFTVGIPHNERFMWGVTIIATATTGHTATNHCRIRIKQEKKIHFTISSPRSLSEVNRLGDRPKVQLCDENWSKVETHPFNVKIHASNEPYYSPSGHNRDSDYDLKIVSDGWKEKGLVLIKPTAKIEDSLLFDKDFNNAESANAAIAEMLSKVGNYTITCCSKENSNWNEKIHYTILSAESNESLNCDGIYLYSGSDTYNRGENLELILGSGIEDLSVFLYKVFGNEVTLLGIYDVGKEQKKIAIPFSEEERGDVILYAFAMKENRSYDTALTFSENQEKNQLTLKMETFRDRVEVGSNEKWKVRVTDFQGKGVKAQLLTYMYNRMVVSYGEKYFNRIARRVVRPSMAFMFRPEVCLYRKDVNNQEFNCYDDFHFHSVYTPFSLNYDYTTLLAIDHYLDFNRVNRFITDDNTVLYCGLPTGMLNDGNRVADVVVTGGMYQNNPRQNFSDGGLFLPFIETDENGYATIDFIAPENITEWNAGIVAHTKDMKSGDCKFNITTYKNLIVSINKPRFMRETDEVEISARIDNLTDTDMECETDILIDDVKIGSRKVKIKANGNEMVTWRIQPQKKNDFFYCTILASGNKHSDGEKILIPYLSNRTLVTETSSVVIERGEKKRFDLEVPKSGRENYQLKLEVVTHPQWLVLAQLPMVGYGENDELIVNRFYECAARYMAIYLAKLMPNAVNAMVEEEMKYGSFSQSPLDKNEDLKQIIFENTPWKIYERSTIDYSQRILEFYEKNVEQKTNEEFKQSLLNHQLGNQLFAWSKDRGEYDLYTSLSIATGVGKLKSLGALTYPPEGIEKLISALDKQFDTLSNHLTDSEVHYLYMRSFYPEIKSNRNNSSDGLKLQNEWYNRPLLLQGMTAVTLHKNGDEEGAKIILKSLLERKQENEAGAFYWAEEWNYSWSGRPIETHALMIELLSLVDKKMYAEEINGVKKWLIMNKKTNSWGSSPATLEACHALLIGVEREELSHANGTIKVNGKVKAIHQDYTQMVYEGEDISPMLKKLTVENNSSDFAVATLYYQYMEDRDKVQSSSSGLEIKRSVIPKDSIRLGDRRII